MYLALACNYLKGKHDICEVLLASKLGYFLIFCQYLIFRIKDYISKGLHMKVTGPNGGIHSTVKKTFQDTGNERDNKVVKLPKKAEL